MGEQRIVVGVRADENAESAATQEADPVAELDAKALELEFLDHRGERLGVACADGRAEPLELGRFLREHPGRLRECERLLQRLFDLRRRELAAERQADEHAAPAAEEEADEVTEGDQAGGLDHAAELLGVSRL